LRNKIEALVSQVLELNKTIDNYRQLNMLIASGFEKSHHDYLESDKYFKSYFTLNLPISSQEAAK